MGYGRQRTLSLLKGYPVLDIPGYKFDVRRSKTKLRLLSKILSHNFLKIVTIINIFLVNGYVFHKKDDLFY